MTVTERLKIQHFVLWIMATFEQIIYMVLDILKEHSDDAYYTEEHILFLAKKMRALLLERKYKNRRNGTFTEMSGENEQQLCIELEPAAMLPFGCSGNWLRSKKEIPELISGSNASVFTVNDLLQSQVTFIPAERMPYVGYNKWLRNIIYAARSSDNHLYLSGNNSQFMFLDKVGMNGVFADPEEAAKLSPENCDGTGGCDIMKQDFPLEDSLVPSCIELVVQELIGSRFAPEDKRNNAKDDFNEAGVTQSKANQAADRISRGNDEA